MAFQGEKGRTVERAGTAPPAEPQSLTTIWAFRFAGAGRAVGGMAAQAVEQETADRVATVATAVGWPYTRRSRCSLPTLRASSSRQTAERQGLGACLVCPVQAAMVARWALTRIIAPLPASAQPVWPVARAIRAGRALPANLGRGLLMLSASGQLTPMNSAAGCSPQPSCA